MEWGRWFRDQFDKLMLLLMFAGQVTLVVWMIRHTMEVGYVNWAQNICSTVLGTLLGLITGKMMSKTDQSVSTQITQSPAGGAQTIEIPAAPVTEPPKEGA